MFFLCVCVCVCFTYILLILRVPALTLGQPYKYTTYYISKNYQSRTKEHFWVWNFKVVVQMYKRKYLKINLAHFSIINNNQNMETN